LPDRKPVYISLDAVSAGYEISLNGKNLGCSTFPGYRFDVSGLLKEKSNKLEVRVANTWRNRIIGDFMEYGELRNCWTTSPVNNLPVRTSLCWNQVSWVRWSFIIELDLPPAFRHVEDIVSGIRYTAGRAIIYAAP